MTSCATVLLESRTQVQKVENEEASEQVSEVEPSPESKDYPVAPFEGDSLYRLLVAEIAGYRSHYDIALKNYALVAEQTEDPGVAARAARMALYLKDDKVALRAVKIWAQTEPDNLSAHRQAVELLLRAGSLEEAIVHMEQVKNLGGSARFEIFAYQAANLPKDKRLALLAAIEEISARHSEDGRLKFSKAILVQQEGRHAEALQIANEILATEKDPDFIILKMSALQGLGREDEARQYLTTQVDALTTNRRLRLVLARLLFEQGDLAEARVQYEKVLEETPNDGDILLALALIAMQSENDAEAERYLERMVRWKSRAGEAHYYLGSLAEKSSDLSAALAHYLSLGIGYD